MGRRWRGRWARHSSIWGAVALGCILLLVAEAEVLRGWSPDAHGVRRRAMRGALSQGVLWLCLAVLCDEEAAIAQRDRAVVGPTEMPGPAAQMAGGPA